MLFFIVAAEGNIYFKLVPSCLSWHLAPVFALVLTDDLISFSEGQDIG